MFEKLQELTKGDPKRLTQYIEVFSNLMLDFSHELDKALREKNFHAVYQVAHGAKSMLQTLALDQDFNDVQLLEHSIKNGLQEENWQKWSLKLSERLRQIHHELSTFAKQ